MRSRVTVLTYHAIGECPAADDPAELFMPLRLFESQMKFLARWRKVIPLGAAVTGVDHGVRPTVAVTFDDGYRSVMEHAAPILSRLSIPATVFVPTKWIGLHNTWDKPYGCPLDILGADELVAAEKAGIRIESHGHAHIDYETSSAEEVRCDIRQSLEQLTDILGRRPAFLAYPFGRSSPEARRIAAEEGLSAAFSISRPAAGPYGIERVGLRPAHGLGVFALKTSGRWNASWRQSSLGSAAAAVLRPVLLRRRPGEPSDP
jgi:peptidoglycan/xylan/chitin deacetylase (PgdA/CDA1 family)